MGWVAWLSLLATLTAWALSRGQGSHLQALATAQALSWIGAKGMHLALGPTFRQVLPLHEFAMLLFVAGLIVAERGYLNFRDAAWWKTAVFVCVLAQACVWINYPFDAPAAERAPHLVVLNVLGFAQLGALIAASVQRRFMA